MEKLKMECYGMVPLGEDELVAVEGGRGWKTVVKGTLLWELVSGVINNWDDVKKGFVDGWNIDK